MKRRNFYEDVVLHELLKKWISPWALNYEYKKIPIEKISGLPNLTNGINGKDGESAYDIAVKNGFVGTQEMWLASLKGESGTKGLDGLAGAPGLNGGHYVFIYKNSKDKPNTPISGMTLDTLYDGWTLNPITPDFAKEENTWMSQCEISGDGVYRGWSNPIRITGPEGKTGEDGADIEFIYTRNNTGETPETPNSPLIDDWSGISNGVVWSDNPQGVQSYLMYEYVSVRYKKNGVWGEYSTPVIWSKWGEKGTDGDGYEYIFILSLTKPKTPRSVNLDDDIPEGWSDEPLSVSETNPYEWACVRKKTNDLWGDYSDPILWTRWAPKGEDGGRYVNLYKNSADTPEIPDGSSSYSVETLISEGWQQTPTAPDFENEEYTYMTQTFFSDGLESAVWSIPVRTTGDLGKPGEDGTRVEFIYKSFTTVQNWDLSNNNPHNWEVLLTKDYLGPEGFEWSDNPKGVNSTNKYEYVSLRIYDGKNWGAFSIPVIWSHWGRDGRDGDGYEYIYKRFTTAQTFSNNNNNPEYWDASQEEDYLGPTGYKWTDDPTGVNSTYKFEYVSTRKKSDEVWGKFSTPVLWANWSKDGEAGATPEIRNGYWYIDGVNTGIKAKGEDGDSAYIGSDGNWWVGNRNTNVSATAQSTLHLDLSNQMDAMGLTYEGVVINTQTFETTITLYSGSSTVPLTGIAYSSVPSGVTVTTNASTGKVTVEILSGTTLENDKLNITLTASSGLGNMSGIFTIIGIRAGEQGEQGDTGEGGGSSPIIYQLVPSENAIKKDKNNNYTPNTITCGIIKKDGSSAPIRYSGSEAVIKMIVDNGSEENYRAISSSSISLKITYRLYQNGILVDVETVPVIEDGEDGSLLIENWVYYAITESNTKPNENEFIYKDGMPSVEDGKYLWTWTHEKYSGGEINDSYSVSRIGIDGHGVKSSVVTYCQKENTNTAPESFSESDWGNYPTELNQNWWLYTRTIVTYSDDTEAISYSSSQIGTGSHYAGTIEYYAVGNTDNSAPSGAPNPGTYTTGQNISIGSNWQLGNRPEANINNPYIWNFEISSDSAGNRYVTNAICIGNWSKSIVAIIELYAVSAYAAPQSGRDYPNDITSWTDGQLDAITTDEKRYLWNKTIVAYNSSTLTNGNWDDSTCDVHYHISCIKAVDGTSVYKDSESIEYVLSTDGVTPKSGQSWGKTRPTPAQGEYVLTRTTIMFSDGSSTVLNSSERNPNDGKPGLTVTITSLKVYYAKTKSAARPNDEKFSEDYPDVTYGDWVHSKTVVIYSNGDSTTTYGIGYIGVNGDSEEGSAGRGISSIVEQYASNNSETTAPDGNLFSTTFPAWDADHKYLWNREVITYTKDPLTETTTPRIKAIWTENGVGIDSIVNYYLANDIATGITKSNYNNYTWSTVCPLITKENPYLWNYEVINYTEGVPAITDPHIIGHFGENGSDGYTIVTNPSPVVLLQDADDVNNWGVSTSSPLEIAVIITKGFDNTNLVNSLSSVSSNVVNVTSSGNTISITGVKNAALVNGTITATANLKDSTTKNISISVGLMRLASFKLNISGSVLTEVAKSFDYNPEGAKDSSLIIENLGKYIRSSREMTSLISTTINGETFSSYMTQTGTNWKTNITDGLSQTGIDITKKNIKLTADNFGIYNNDGTKTFSIDSNGNLISSGNAGFSGKLTATSGTIGGWNIDNKILKSEEILGEDNYKTQINLNPAIPLITISSTLSTDSNINRMVTLDSDGINIFKNGLYVNHFGLDGNNTIKGSTVFYNGISLGSEVTDKAAILNEYQLYFFNEGNAEAKLDINKLLFTNSNLGVTQKLADSTLTLKDYFSGTDEVSNLSELNTVKLEIIGSGDRGDILLGLSTSDITKRTGIYDPILSFKNYDIDSSSLFNELNILTDRIKFTNNKGEVNTALWSNIINSANGALIKDGNGDLTLTHSAGFITTYGPYQIDMLDRNGSITIISGDAVTNWDRSGSTPTSKTANWNNIVSIANTYNSSKESIGFTLGFSSSGYSLSGIGFSDQFFNSELSSAQLLLENQSDRVVISVEGITFNGTTKTWEDIFSKL